MPIPYGLGVGVGECPPLKPHPMRLEWLKTGELLNCYRNMKILLRKIFNLLFFHKKCPSLAWCRGGRMPTPKTPPYETLMAKNW
jgi:hypothetical protein